MIDPKKSIVLGLAAALMLTTSVSAHAIPDDGTRPLPAPVATPDPAANKPAPDVIGDEVGAVEIDDADDVDDEDDFEDDDEDGDDDEDDVADDDDEDEDGEEDDVAEDEDGDDGEEDAAEADDEDGDEDDVAEGEADDEDSDEEDVAEGEAIDGPDAVEEGSIYEIVTMTDCKTRHCGTLVLSDTEGRVIYSTINNFDPVFEASLAPHEVTFASVHVGCKLRGYFQVVEGADGEERNGFYVQEFL